MPRPRSVPEAQALDHALLVFWEKGYDRASIADLGKAIGVGPSSIYNAFGSKAQLYRKVLDHYVCSYTGFVPALVDGVGERGLEVSLLDLLRRAIVLYTDKGHPPGCAMLEGGGAGGSADSEGGRIAREFRAGLERSLRTLFETAARRESLSAPPRVLAKYTLGVMRGLSQLACDGTSRRQLLEIATHAAGTCVSPSED